MSTLEDDRSPSSSASAAAPAPVPVSVTEVFRYSAADKQLSAVGADLESVPADLGTHFKLSEIEVLDLSHNCLRTIPKLTGFTNLKSLVLDNNEIEAVDAFPTHVLPKLETLWINNNKILDFEPLFSTLSKATKLKHFSGLKNPACPNPLIGKDVEDYQRYRYFALYHLKNLQFLEANAVTQEERKEGARVGQFMKIARPKNDSIGHSRSGSSTSNGAGGSDGAGSGTGSGSGSGSGIGNGDDVSQQRRSSDSNEDHRAGHGSYFAYSRYVYCGAKSEGNRFITNPDL